MKKYFAVILIISMAFTMTSCRQSNNEGNTISSSLSNEPSLLTDDSSDTTQDIIDADEKNDMGRTSFTVDFFGEAAGNSMKVSLNLPSEWTSEPSGIFDDQGDWIASVELHKKTANKAFTDTDELYENVVSTKEMTVSGYSVKLYTLEFEKGGNGEMEAGTQYLYYIMVDDAYVLLFFSPKGTTGITADVFDNIVSSFEVVTDVSSLPKPKAVVEYDSDKMPDGPNINAAPVADLTDLYTLTEVYVWPLTINGGIWYQSWSSPSEIPADQLIYVCAFNQWVQYDFSDEKVQPFAPAEEVEAALQKHFDVTTDYLRTATSYNTENNTYPMIEGGGGWGVVAISAEQEGNQTTIQVGLLHRDVTQVEEMGFLTLELTEENVVRYRSYEYTQDR